MSLSYVHFARSHVLSLFLVMFCSISFVIFVICLVVVAVCGLDQVSSLVSVYSNNSIVFLVMLAVCFESCFQPILSYVAICFSSYLSGLR